MRHAPFPGHTDEDDDGDYITRDAEPLTLEVDDTPNPIVDVLLGPAGEVIRTWRERPLLGFHYEGRR